MQAIDQAGVYHMEANNSTRILRKAGIAVITGVGGNLVLGMFMMTFLNVWGALKFIPWILAFNSAATGYGLIVKIQSRSPRWKIWAATAGLMTAGISVGIMALYFVYRFGETVFTPQDLIVYSAVTTVASLLGGLLAVKYIKLSRQ